MSGPWAWALFLLLLVSYLKGKSTKIHPREWLAYVKWRIKKLWKKIAASGFQTQ
jgi:hypothetical protein